MRKEDLPVPRSECNSCEAFWTRDRQPVIGRDFGYFSRGLSQNKKNRKAGIGDLVIYHLTCRDEKNPESGLIQVIQGRENGEDLRQGVAPVVDKTFVAPSGPTKPMDLIERLSKNKTPRKKTPTFFAKD